MHTIMLHMQGMRRSALYNLTPASYPPYETSCLPQIHCLPPLTLIALRQLRNTILALAARQVKSSQGTNSRPPEWQLRKLRVPLESPTHHLL